MFKTDAEIEADMQAIINDKYPPAMREKAMRLGGTDLLALNDFFVTMSALKAEKIAERDAMKLVWEAEQPLTTPPVPEKVA